VNKNWLVFLVLLLWAAPVAMLAQFQYTTNADGVSVTITGYAGLPWDVAIPTNINGFTVTGIGGKGVFSHEWSGRSALGFQKSYMICWL
jgi:hypothetical protein